MSTMDHQHDLARPNSLWLNPQIARQETHSTNRFVYSVANPPSQIDGEPRPRLVHEFLNFNYPLRRIP
jgi:hypothetical protein